MRETVEFLSVHTLGKEEDATDSSFKTKSQETDCVQNANSSVRIVVAFVKGETNIELSSDMPTGKA